MSGHGVPRVSGVEFKVDAYKERERDVTERIKAGDYSNATLQATSQLLSLNPEYYTIWNYRRLVLGDVFARERDSGDRASVEDDADAQAAQKAGVTPAQREISMLIKEDLQFLIPLLRQYPKCYWIWNHRSWLLSVATADLPTTVSIELWRGELALVGKMLALDSRNFHGWDYRRSTVAEIEQLSGGSLTEPEFEYTTKMIGTNLSNFSAWHYRSQLIPRVLNEREAGSVERRVLLDAEFELITRALYTDPYDQSLWFYHQYLISTLSPSRLTGSTSILDPCTNTDRLNYLSQELDSIKDMLDGAEDCKYIYQALLDYSRLYLDGEPTNEKVTVAEMSQWLEELKTLDPLREGRWKDWEVEMNHSREQSN